MNFIFLSLSRIWNLFKKRIVLIKINKIQKNNAQFSILYLLYLFASYGTNLDKFVGKYTKKGIRIIHKMKIVEGTLRSFIAAYFILKIFVMKMYVNIIK